MKMMKMMKVEVERRKLIKPLTATPSHLRSYKISLIDELNPSMHVVRILFYPSSVAGEKLRPIIINLEESLARILPLFYPLAGRYIKEKHLVDCNDQGVEFSEATVDCDLVAVTRGRGGGAEHFNHLLPIDICSADEPTDPILAVRINRFRCGGVAIGVCVSHRISDSACLGIFLQAWKDAATGGSGSDVIKPDFNSHEFFPSENLPPLHFGVSRTRDTSVICERFMFDKEAISVLRDIYTAAASTTLEGGDRPPSRVVVVSAVLTQALLRADMAKKGGVPSAALIAQAINVRERTVPPVSKHAWGTWVSLSYLEYSAEEARLNLLETGDFPGLVRKMRETTIQGVKDCPRILSEREFGRWVLVDSYFDAAKKASNPNYKVIWITDWSKFGEYELDFGFGKPEWVSLADVPLKDMFVLMNNKDNDGIEAWVYLHESDMPFFEHEYHRVLGTLLTTAPTT